ncbi:MAG: VIT1/CCC1 transporter family protein [Rhodomicrobiaceae bacterium]
MDQTEDHTPEAIKTRLAVGQTDSYLREWVYGGIDGVVTTFAIAAGVVGASLSPKIILILGAANLIGDGFSMAAGCYSATKTENDNYQRLRNREISHIKNYPGGEREEIRQIYAAKGFKNRTLEKIVNTISDDPKLWVDVMMAEEYGLSSRPLSALKTAYHTFFAFFICGAVPLLPFLVKVSEPFLWACILSAFTFFAIGAGKSIWSFKPWWWHGLETTIIGSAAAGMAFTIGYWLRFLGLEG